MVLRFVKSLLKDCKAADSIGEQLPVCLIVILLIGNI